MILTEILIYIQPYGASKIFYKVIIIQAEIRGTI